MEIGRRFVSTTCIVNNLLIFVPVFNEAVLGSIHNAGNVQKNIENLFDSVARNNSQRSETIRSSLKHDVEKEQEAFDAMKVEWLIPRNKNANKLKSEGKKVVMVKRETTEESYDPNSAFRNPGHSHNHPHHNIDGFDFDADNDSANESVEWVQDPRLVSDPTYHSLIEMVLQLWWSQRGFVHNVRHETDLLKTLKSVTVREVDDKVNEIDATVEGQIDSLSLWDNPESVDLNHFMNETVREEMLRKWTAADQSFSTYQIDNAAEICSRLRHEFKAAREDLSHRWQRIDSLLCELTEQEQLQRAEEEEKEKQRREEEENECEP